MGLRKLNQSVLLPDNLAVRGLVFKVRHLVTVEEIGEEQSEPETSRRARTYGQE
jgi:large subunit ribosomal protein L30